MTSDKINELLEITSKSGNMFIEYYTNTEALKINSIRNLVICGMGGSGISGNYIQDLNSSSVNVIVNKSYEFSQLYRDDYAIVISYSGNTEETLQMTNELIEKKIEFVIISSGGKLEELSKIHNIPFYNVAKGMQPRAAFSLIFGRLYKLTQNILSLEIIDEEMKLKIINSSNIDANNELKQLLKSYTSDIVNKTPIILSPQFMKSVGLRFRCQLNENAKLFASNFSLPEYNHNGIVGIDGIVGSKQLFIMIQNRRIQNKRTNLHFDFYDNLSNNIGGIIKFDSSSKSQIISYLEITWQLDYLSVLLAQHQNIDPISVPSINKLKYILKNTSKK